MPRINPENLRWARERAGLSLEDAARGIITGLTGAERLAQMESGQQEPTRRQLVELAKRYHRPLLAFYLETPPENGERSHDFRTVRDPDIGKEGLLDALVRDARVRQALLRGALEDEEEAEPLPFVGSADAAAGADALSAALTRTLRIDIAEYRASQSTDAAFAKLRDAVEQIGVFVLLIGNLGNYHSSLDPRVFRGFSIARPVAPFVVINETDAKVAWSFTLLHELAHIFLGQTAISGYESDNALERLCDDAASMFLVRADELRELPIRQDAPFEVSVEQIGRFASERKVSRKMIAYKLWRTQRISGDLYRQLEARFDADRIEAARRNRERGASGGDYYVVRRHRAGPSLLRTVDRMVSSGVLTTPQAGKVLGVKPTAVVRLTRGA